LNLGKLNEVIDPATFNNRQRGEMTRIDLECPDLRD
jgi:hypothetical protein